MAKLSAHDIIGEIRHLTYLDRYCSDAGGKVLRNSGQGWKVSDIQTSKVRSHQTSYHLELERMNKFEDDNPSYQEYLEALHDLPIASWFSVNHAIYSYCEEDNGTEKAITDLDIIFPSYSSSRPAKLTPTFITKLCELCTIWKRCQRGNKLFGDPTNF